MGDAHDNPYKIQIKPLIFPCAECGEVGPAVAFRNREIDGKRVASFDVPLDPLCADDAAIERRVWGSSRLPDYAQPGDEASYVDDDGVRWHVTLCWRCGGTGQLAGGHCFECWGARWSFISTQGVRRTARWWQTYQQNRQPEVHRDHGSSLPGTTSAPVTPPGT